jgi:hypothetical protein
MRPLDRNETLYVEARWRDLVIVNRISMIGMGCVCALTLGAAVVFAVLFFSRGGKDLVFGVVVVSLFLGMTALFGFIFYVRLKVEGAAEPPPTMAFDIAGPFWEKTSARSNTRHGIGDTDLFIPPHWLRLLRRTARSRVFTAEITDGPAETSILLSVNGVLSISDEIARGYLTGNERGSLAPVFAALALSAFAIAAIAASASHDPDLTLWRYLQVGSGVAQFSSVAELERAHPAAFGRVRLGGVILERSGLDKSIARDEPPAALSDAAQLTSELDRIGHEIEQAPCVSSRPDCSASDQQKHAETVAREVGKVLESAETWVERLATARPGGLGVRSQNDLAPDLDDARRYFRDARRTLGTEDERAKRARDRIDTYMEGVSTFMRANPAKPNFDVKAVLRESARRLYFEAAETELKDVVSYAQSEIDATARVVAVRHTLDGILYRRSSGEEWLAVKARYDLSALWTEAIAYVLGIVTAILIGISARGFVRGRRAGRRSVEALPSSL